MSVSFECKNRIKQLIASANATTGEANADLTSAVKSLISGYRGVGDSGNTTTEGGLINGYKFACGTVSFDADQSQAVRIEHEDVGATIAIFVYVPGAPVVAEEGSPLRYRFGGYYLNIDCAEIGRSGSIFAVNGGVSVATGGTAARNRITALSNTSFDIGCDGTYPLRAGLIYHWIVIGGG